MLERTDSSYVLILGFENSKVNDPAATLAKLRGFFPRTDIQLMRADRVAGTEHLSFAARRALRAFSQKHGRSHSVAMEILLYASCQRQISKAIQTLGVTPGTGQIAIVAVSKSLGGLDGLTEAATEMLGGKMSSEALEITSGSKLAELKSVFGIVDLELEVAMIPGERQEAAVTRLIIERSALLALEN